MPGRNRIVLVQTHGPSHLVPQPLGVRFAEDLPRPALVRVRHAGPVHGPLLEDDLECALRQRLPSRLADAYAVEVRENIGVRIARDTDRRRADAREVLEPLELP